MKKRTYFSLLLCLAVLLAACVPSSAPALTMATLSDSVSYDAGRTTISWDITGDELSRYVVFLEPVDNGSVKQQMIRVGTTSGHSIEALDPIPGKSYDVYVADEGFQILGKKTYRIPDAPEFKNGKMTKKSAKISMEPRKMRSGGDRKKDTKKVKKLVASEIRDGLDNKSTVYGVKYNIRMPQLAKGREFFTTIAMEAPNGFMFTVVADTLSFDRVKNGYQNLWFYMIGDTFFDYLYRNTGEIPTGNYKVSLFWDGMWVNTSTFSVK